MTRDRVIVALLGAIAILLAMNLLRGEPEAMGQAQNPPGLGDAPVVPVAMSVVQNTPDSTRYRVFRMWSDGSVDTTLLRFSAISGGDPDAACNIQSACTVEVPID